MKKEVITVIVPCYNEEESLPLFYEEIKKVALEFKEKNVKLELLFVDDGSKDHTLEIIKDFSKDKDVHYLSFSRNFGKEAAIYAGLSKANGDYITLMDADLQDPPKMLLEMYHYLKDEDYDTVGVRRKTRKGEPIIRSFFANMFYKIIAKISKTEMVPGARDFRLMKKQVVEAILSLEEYNRYSKGLFSFVGFKTKWLEYENVKRVAGTSKWSFWKLMLYAFDAIIAFSTAPLVIATFLGILFCLISFILILIIIFKTLIFGDPVSGWPSLVCIIFFVSGIQLFCLGISSAYLSKTYLEVKKRPVYIIKESDVN